MRYEKLKKCSDLECDGWISADKPPEHSRDVLVCYVNEDMEVAHYEGGRWWRGKFFTDIIDKADIGMWSELPKIHREKKRKY